ncbi:MAG: hypothetical protein WA004_19530 [Saprospiraceae bacterium]
MRNLSTFAILLFFFQQASAQQQGLTLFDRLHRQDTILEITITCDWDSVLAVRKTETEIEGKLQFAGRNGAIDSWDTGVSSRGKFRRRICEFPPIKLEFSKKDLREAGLLPFDDLKLVTHCLDNPDSGERIIREYLIYRIYQMLSPYHCRVQLVRVNYADEDHSRPDEVHIGMLIEEDRMRANRLGLNVVDTLNLHYGNFPPNMPDVHGLFQYLIGNTDWSLVASRNLEMLRDEKTGLFYLIPFDFDFSGLVNAPYAVPNPDYRLTNIRQRVYLGPQPPSEQARMQVLAVKKDLLKFIRKFPHLSMEAKADIIEYLNTGFGDIKRNKLALPGQG